MTTTLTTIKTTIKTTTKTAAPVDMDQAPYLLPHELEIMKTFDYDSPRETWRRMSVTDVSRLIYPTGTVPVSMRQLSEALQATCKRLGAPYKVRPNRSWYLVPPSRSESTASTQNSNRRTGMRQHTKLPTTSVSIERGAYIELRMAAFMAHRSVADLIDEAISVYIDEGCPELDEHIRVGANPVAVHKESRLAIEPYRIAANATVAAAFTKAVKSWLATTR